MKITGEQLREEREKQGLTKEEVAMVVKINVKTVTAIEEGDLDALPPKTFLRGFVRSYSKLLKLDTEAVLSQFLEEMGSTRPKLAIRDQENEDERKQAIKDSMVEEQSPLFKRVLWFSVSFVAIIMIVFVFKQVKKYENESITSAETPEVAAISPANEEKVTEKPTIEVKAEEDKLAEEAKKKEEEEKKKLEEEKAKLAEEKKQKEAEKAQKIATELPKKEEKRREIKLTNNEIIIEAFNNIKVDYSINNGSKSTFELVEDDIRVIKGHGEIKVSISDGGEANIVHNGKDLGVPGKQGKPIELTF